jgi:hypothetical protein
MARQKKRPPLTHCKVTLTTHPRAPWRVSYPSEVEGKAVRLRRMFASEDDAWTFAATTDTEVANHGRRFGGMPPEARRGFDFYRDKRAELEADGVALPSFEEIIANAITDARREHEARLQTAKFTMTVADGVEAFTEYKKTRVKERQLYNLKNRLKRFTKDFGTRTVASVTTDEIAAWLAGLRSLKNSTRATVPPLLDPLTRNHYFAVLASFFKFAAAKGRGWCDGSPVDDLEREVQSKARPKAYTPEDAAQLMHTAVTHFPELVPFLALGMFAGLRTSEAMVFELGGIEAGDVELHVPDEHKTGERLAPYTDACKAWMEAQPRHRGKAWDPGRELSDPARELSDRTRELSKMAGVKAIFNGCRHSFISYRTAELRDVGRVADECGTGVATIKKHYRKVVTSEAAARYFAIRPPSAPEAGKVVALQDGRASA